MSESFCASKKYSSDADGNSCLILATAQEGNTTCLCLPKCESIACTPSIKIS